MSVPGERTGPVTGDRDTARGPRRGRVSALRAALRISLGNARQARGRTALIVVMIALPVLVITAMLTLLQTFRIDAREGLTADIGAADARVRTTTVWGELRQNLRGHGFTSHEDFSGRARPWTRDQVAGLLGPGSRLVPMNEGTVLLPGVGDVRADETDLRDPVTAGKYRLVRGNLPTSAREVVVTPAMLERGARLGGTLTVKREKGPLRVVGIVEHPHRVGDPQIVGLPGALLPPAPDGLGTGWLADTPGPVTWATVRRLNAVGLLVQSRAVIENPPAQEPFPEGGLDASQTMGVGLAGVMILLEVVLLAGPAFAVGLRRRRRELALIFAQGGSPAHLRAIVLADGLVLGGGAAVSGLILGVGLAVASLSLGAGRLLGTTAPLEIPWGTVVIVALLGAGSGLAAAALPAVQAARQNAAAVLGGRADGARARRGRPMAGLILLVLGGAAGVFTLRFDMVWALTAAALTQFGLIALTPGLVGAAARPAARLPLALRLAVRDAARHRGRTACAVAAVMTASAAVVMAGIVVSSGSAEFREAFQTAVPVGTTVVEAENLDDDRWARLRAAAERVLPGVPLVEGAVVRDAEGAPVGLMPRLRPRPFPGSVPIGDGRLLTLVQGRPDPVASAAFASGKAVVFDRALVRGGRLRLEVNPLEKRSVAGPAAITIPAVVAPAAHPRQAVAVLPTAAVEGSGLRTKPGVLYVDPAVHRLTFAERTGLQWEVNEVAPETVVRVEARVDRDVSPELWLLFGAALALVLGGTFVATGLAVADMRPDLATMAAAGARPGTHRLVAAGQAGFVAGLGVLTGAAAGVVTGVVVTWPARAWRDPFETLLSLGDGGFFLLPESSVVEIPWFFLAATVIGLPTLAAAVAGAFVRTGARPLRRAG